MYLNSRIHLKLQCFQSLAVKNTLSVQILQLYTQAHKHWYSNVYTYKHILYTHICTSTCIIYIYSNLPLEQKKKFCEYPISKTSQRGKRAWFPWSRIKRLINTRWRPWSTDLTEANSLAVKSQGHKLSFFLKVKV